MVNKDVYIGVRVSVSYIVLCKWRPPNYTCPNARPSKFSPIPTVDYRAKFGSTAVRQEFVYKICWKVLEF